MSEVKYYKLEELAFDAADPTVSFDEELSD